MLNYFEKGTANLPRKSPLQKITPLNFFLFFLKLRLKGGRLLTPPLPLPILVPQGVYPPVKIKDRQLSVFVMQSKIISHFTPEILWVKTKDDKLDAHFQIPMIINN